MSCCINRGYNDSTCQYLKLQATDSVIISLVNPQGLGYSGNLLLTQGTDSLSWSGSSDTSRLTLTGGGTFSYLGCPSCPLLEVNLRQVLEGQISIWRGSLQLIQGVASGYLQRTQGSGGPFRYRIEGVYQLICETGGRRLRLDTLRLEPRSF